MTRSIFTVEGLRRVPTALARSWRGLRAVRRLPESDAEQTPVIPLRPERRGGDVPEAA